VDPCGSESTTPEKHITYPGPTIPISLLDPKHLEENKPKLIEALKFNPKMSVILNNELFMT
jgi:hypothetical protein